MQIKKKPKSDKSFPDPISFIQYDAGDSDSAYRLFVETVKELVEKYGTDKKIMVLGRHTFDINQIIQDWNNEDRLRKGINYNDATGKIKIWSLDYENLFFTTVHKSKGLEADNVIVLHSQAYHRVMTSGSLCTAYQNQKGDTLKKFSSQVIEKALAENKKENLRTVKPNKSTSKKKNSQSKHPKKESISEKNGNQAKRVYWENTIRYSCGSCAWWEYETCTNKSSSVCGEKMKRGALCTRYQHEKTDPLLEFKNGIVEFVIM